MSLDMWISYIIYNDNINYKNGTLFMVNLDKEMEVIKQTIEDFNTMIDDAVNLQ